MLFAAVMVILGVLVVRLRSGVGENDREQTGRFVKRQVPASCRCRHHNRRLGVVSLRDRDPFLQVCRLRPTGSDGNGPTYQSPKCELVNPSQEALR